jgi:ABC-2 type transport system ATP-binding protein
MRRVILAAAFVVLAIAAAPRVQLDYASTISLPQLTVDLSMPASAGSDPAETSARWVEPIESAIRSLGDVTATRGEVSADSATITVRFRPGVDAEMKSARLTSELANVRARLPREASLAVWPSRESGARPSAYLAMTSPGGAEAAERVANELRVVPGVREVQVHGGSEVETLVQLDASRFPNVSADAVREAIAASVAPRAISSMSVSGRTFAVGSAARARRIEEVRVGGVRLESIASVRERRTAPTSLSRYNGRPAVMLEVLRDSDVPLFTFASALRARASTLGLTEVWSEATEMRALLARLGIGALLAMLILAIAGVAMRGPRGAMLAFYIPLAFAVALNGARIFGARVDAYTVLVATIAIAGMMPLAAIGSRRAAIVTALFLALLPIAVALGSGQLAPLLEGPARAFAATGICAIIAASIVRGAGRGPAVPPAAGRRLLPRALRSSVTIVLAATTLTVFLLSWFGTRLDPRRAGQSVERGRLYIFLTLPAGTTLASTSKAVAMLEERLGEERAIKRFWSLIMPSRARIELELTDHAQSIRGLDLLKLRLQQLVRVAPGSSSISEAFQGGVGGRFSGDLEDHAEADEDGTFYRVLVKSTRPEVMQRIVDEMERRAMRLNIPRSSVRPDWASGTTRIELVPRPSTSFEAAARAVARIGERTSPPGARRLPDGRLLRVVASGAPVSSDQAPQRADLFTRPLEDGTIPSLFEPRTTTVIGQLTRELGRYVLPVVVHMSTYDEQALEQRIKIDRSFASIALPPGTLLERPSLSKWTFSKEKLRLLGLAAFLPLLLLAAACVVLNSAQRALIAAAPAALAIALAAPMLLMTESEVDEITLLAIAAAVCCVLPVIVDLVIRAGSSTAATYRAVRISAFPLIACALAAAALLAVPAFTAEALRSGWRAPLVACAAVLFVALASTAVLPAAILIALREAKRRGGSVAQATRHPEEWVRGDSPSLGVASLTKTYAAGFRALHRVSFELTPGIVGLLGPNGAGKTTLLRTITGLLAPTRGQIVFRGVPVTPENLADYRHHVGFLPQEFNAYSGLTAAQFLDYWAIERGMTEQRARLTEIERLLAIAGLAEHANRRVRDFSGGMRQRIGIARALIGDPSLIVVDEPTTGLDIEARAHFRELLLSLAAERIVILSTHIASDVESTASRILVLVRGTLRWDGTPDALIAAARGRVFEAIVGDAEARALSRRRRVTKRVRTHDGIRIRAVVREHDSLEGAAVEPTLEEAYLAMASEGDVRVATFSFLGESATPAS